MASFSSRPRPAVILAIAVSVALIAQCARGIWERAWPHLSLRLATWATPYQSAESNLRLLLGADYETYCAVRDRTPLDATVSYALPSPDSPRGVHRPWLVLLVPRLVRAFLLAPADFEPLLRGASAGEFLVDVDSGLACDWARFGELVVRGPGFSLWRARGGDARGR